MRVLLVNSTVRFGKVSWQRLETTDPVQAGPSCGLLTIAGVLAERGHDVTNIDPNVYPSWDAFREAFEPRLRGTDVLGVSSYSPSIMADAHIMQMARQVKPTLLILLGGYFPTLRGDIALTTTEADIIIRGEADRMAAEVVNRLEATEARHPLGRRVCQSLGDLVGVRVRYVDGGQELFSADNGKASLTEDELNELPTPLWHIAPLDHYEKIWKKRYISFATSRGCDHHCSICSIIDAGGCGIRSIHPKTVVDRLVESLEQVPDLEYVFFADPHFTFDRNRTQEICRRIVDAKRLGRLPEHLLFGCETRVDTIYDDVLDSMRDAGWRTIWFGLESGSIVTLKQYRKGQDVSQGYEAVRRVASRGMIPIGFFIVAAPESRIPDILGTLDLVVFLLEQGGDVTPDVAYCLLSWEGTTQMKETRNKGWDLSYVVDTFVKRDPVTGTIRQHLVAEGGYVFPLDPRARYVMRNAYEYSTGCSSVNTSSFVAGLFHAFHRLFEAFPQEYDELRPVVADLYRRARGVASRRRRNTWDIPFDCFLELDLTF